MNKIVECVPNFSEGRDQQKIAYITSAFLNNEKVKLVSVESDSDYNRTVVTLIGDGDAIIESLMEFTKRCIETIDMNVQSGQHPRMGAVDVIPFIPLEGVKMKDCIDYANVLGEKLASTFSVPVFLYAEAARKEDRESLPSIRKGEFEGMKDKIKESNWAPDFGAPEIHPTFGAVAVGAREFLVAYNIDIKTMDESIPNEIAKAIRKSSGGFEFVQSGPATLEARGHTQVTMNILNYKKNPMYRIFETVKSEAKRFQINITSAEIIGLIPKNALYKSIEYYLQCDGLPSPEKNISIQELVSYSRKYLLLRDFDENKVIETYL